MGLLRRIADALDPTPPPAAETRAQEVSWDALRGGVDIGTGIVNPRMAENLSAVLACVGAISSAMASLPAYVYRRLDKGREIDETHPLALLIARGPNEHSSWPDFIEWLMASVLLRGNGLAEIITNPRGAVVGLKPIPWEFCSVQLLAGGRLVYDITEITHMHGGTGRPRRLLQDEVLHLRDRSDDGLLGRSRLQRAAAAVQSGLSMQAFGNALYVNGVRPSGTLSAAGSISDETAARLAREFHGIHAGPNNAAKTIVMGDGLKWEAMSITPEDAEFLASRRFSVEELCRLFGVPPPVAGDLSHGTFSNVESLLRWFAQATLTPWCRKLEAEFTRSVFSAATRATHQLELDLSGLLRGDPTARWQSHAIAVDKGILTADEVREIEGWNPRGEKAPAAT